MKTYKVRLQRVIARGEEEEVLPFWDTVLLERIPGDLLYEYQNTPGFFKILEAQEIFKVEDDIKITELFWTPPSASMGKIHMNGLADNYASTKSILKSADPVLTEQDAAYYLQKAQDAMQQRGQLRDRPSGERSMETIVATFNALTGHTVTESEGWEFMVLLKMVRGRQGKFNADDYVDGSAYFGLLGECNAKNR